MDGLGESGILFTPLATVQFQQGGLFDVKYTCPPLPLLPPSPLDQEHVTSQQRLRVLSITSDEIDAQLLCYCSGDCTLCVCQIFEQRSSRESELHRSFEEWSCAESTVTCSGRRWCEMQQKISGLDSEVVEGITYLCAVCTMQLAVYTIPLSKESLLFSWMDDSIIYSSPYKISCSKLSPFVPGQVLVMTECGGLCIHQESLQVKVIRASVIEGSVGSTMCLFGTHPGHLLWMEKGKLYSSDLRTDQLPLQAMTPAVQVGEGNVEVMCIGSGGQPFHVLVATKKELLVLDIRQPAEPLLTVSHHLTHPVTRLHAVQDTATCIVLVSSSDANVVLSYTCTSFSVVLTSHPHAVCSLSDMLRYAKHFKLRALCSQVEHRLKKPTVGATFFSLPSGNGYAAIVLTALNDVMYQCWQYSSPAAVVAISSLTNCQSLGLRLWMKQACTERKTLKLQTRTTKNWKNVAQHLMHGSSQATPCVSCGLELNGRTCDEVVELKRLYEELVPSNDLDTALVTEWGASELEELLNEESDDMID